MPRIKVNMVEVAKASARIKIAENAVKDVSDDINYARWRVDDRIAERRGIGSRLNQIINTVNQIESDMENIENTIIRGASQYSDIENSIVASGREIKNRIRAQIFAVEAATGALGISKDILKITGIDKVLEKIWDGNQESGKTVPVSNNEKITDVKSNNESVWNLGTDLAGSAAVIGATVVETKSSNVLWDAIREQITGIPEDIKSAGETLAWIEKQWGKLPDEVTHSADVFVPGTVKTAYTLTSSILQGNLTPEEGWEAAKSILKKDSTLAVVCGAIDYALDKGIERSDKMQQELLEQLKEGDAFGFVSDALEGTVDTIFGGCIEVLGNMGGDLVDTAVDNIPVVKSVNQLIEYKTGLLGWNDGKGYSVGGLIGAGAEKLSDGIDAATDFITDKIDSVTDVVTDGLQNGINWVRSWFD